VNGTNISKVEELHFECPSKRYYPCKSPTVEEIAEETGISMSHNFNIRFRDTSGLGKACAKALE
jgi:hypothetical protein